MASPFCCTKIAPKSFSNHRFLNFQPSFRAKAFKTNCKLENPTESSSSTKDSEPENLLLKAAWYGSELLGIAASYVRSPKNVEETPELALDDGSGVIDRAAVVESIKGDFQRSYFVTGFFAGALFSDVLLSVLLFVLIFFMCSFAGNLALDAYEENCEFADPAGSFRGLRRFKRNCSNFGSLLEKSNMKLMKWEDSEVSITSIIAVVIVRDDLYVFLFFRDKQKNLCWMQEKAIGHWRFSCTLSFPWKPILSGKEPQRGYWVFNFFRFSIN